MPVRDLTDRPRQMPRLGKIRLGDQSGTNGSPKNLPHFVVPDEVAAVYGENPTELPIVFLSDDEEVIASSYYRAYNASNGLVCKGDGFMANAMLDAAVLHRHGGAFNQPMDINLWAHGATRGENVPATKDVVRQEVDCWGAGYGDLPPCPMFALKKCAVRTFFQFAIYGVPGLGVYQMDTGSVINVGRLLGTLAMARTVLGGISGVPMILSREKTDVAPTGTKHGVYTVNLRIDTKFSLTEVLKLRAGPVANALLPPVDESEVYENIDDDTPALPAPREEPQQAPVSESAGPGSSLPGQTPAAPSPGTDRHEHEAQTQAPESTQGVVSAAPASASPAVPAYDWRGFIASLKERSISTQDLMRVVVPAKGQPTASDFIRWVEEHDATPDDLATAIIKAKQGACEHDAGQYDEALTTMRCSKCGYDLDVPAEEPVAAGLGI